MYCIKGETCNCWGKVYFSRWNLPVDITYSMIIRKTVLFGSIEITLLVQHHNYKYFIFEHFLYSNIGWSSKKTWTFRDLSDSKRACSHDTVAIFCIIFMISTISVKAILGWKIFFEKTLKMETGGWRTTKVRFWRCFLILEMLLLMGKTMFLFFEKSITAGINVSKFKKIAKSLKKFQKNTKLCSFWAKPFDNYHYFFCEKVRKIYFRFSCKAILP